MTLPPEPETLDQLPFEDLIDILGRLAEDVEDPEAPSYVRHQALGVYAKVCDEIDRRAHL